MKVSGLSYAQVTKRFSKSGLCHSTRQVRRYLRKHEADCPPKRFTYHKVRFDSRKVDALIRKILRNGNGHQ